MKILLLMTLLTTSLSFAQISPSAVGENRLNPAQEWQKCAVDLGNDYLYMAQTQKAKFMAVFCLTSNIPMDQCQSQIETLRITNRLVPAMQDFLMIKVKEKCGSPLGESK